MNVLDELAASICRVEVSRVRMHSDYIGRLHGRWPVRSVVEEKETAWSVPI
jgi:hypothetical protein